MAKEKKIFSSKNGHWGVLGPQGPPLGLRVKFGLVCDPGGLANDVSKAKNLVQIFSGENACFSQSRSVNTQYMRNPDMAYVLKMEYVSKINIFGLKMMVKSGLEKIFLKFLHAHTMSFLLLNL